MLIALPEITPNMWICLSYSSINHSCMYCLINSSQIFFITGMTLTLKGQESSMWLWFDLLEIFNWLNGHLFLPLYLKSSRKWGWKVERNQYRNQNSSFSLFPELTESKYSNNHKHKRKGAHSDGMAAFHKIKKIQQSLKLCSSLFTMSMVSIVLILHMLQDQFLPMKRKKWC